MFFAGKKRRPVWQPSKFERLRRAFSANVHVSWKHLLAALLLLFFAGVILPELFRPVVLIDPISVPKLLEERGLTAQVVADEVAERTASMAMATRAAPIRLASDSSLPEEVEVPATKLSLRSVVQLLQVFLHRQPPHIHADIVCLMPGCTAASPATSGAAPSERLDVIYRFTDGKALPVHNRFRATDIDDAVAQLSRLALTNVNPYVMARYADEIDHDPATALRILESCANDKDCAQKPWVLFNIWGNVLARQGKLEEAIAKYQKAIELNPKYAPPYSNWGYALRDQSNVLRDQGNALAGLDKSEQAIAKYQKAIELDPKFAFPYLCWGDVLQDQGKPDEAIAKYQKATELDPKYALAYRSWARALRQQGNSEEAAAKERKADELDSMAAGTH